MFALGAESVRAVPLLPLDLAPLSHAARGGTATGESPDAVWTGRTQSADEWAEAVTPSSAELEAIRRAIEKAGSRGSGRADRASQKPRRESHRGSAGLWDADAQPVPEIMAAYYRQQAENHLLKPPPQRRLGELQVPTTLEEWEIGDPTRDIDWTATLILRGRELGGAMPFGE